MASNQHAVVIPPPAATNAASGTNGLRDIRGPVPLPAEWFWLWLVLGALATLAGLWWLWRKWSRRPPPPPPLPMPAHERARRQLLEALRLIHEAKPFCTAVSDVIRAYLEARFELHAPERTTEEFLNELRVSDRLTTDQKSWLADFLNECDLVKFARHEPTQTELQQLHSAASRLVDETADYGARAAEEGAVPA